MLTTKFDFLAPTCPSVEIRTRATARDQYAGLRGHAYITARQLNQQIQRVQKFAQPGATSNKNDRKSQ